MIREITRQEIDVKTAQGERVLLVEAQAGAKEKDSYGSGHIPSALAMPVGRVRQIAAQYLRNPAAELVIYGEDERSADVDEVAWQLALLGYYNVYVYRGGKRDWFGHGEFIESMHEPPEPGSHVRFEGSPGRVRATVRSPAAPWGFAAAALCLGIAWSLSRIRWMSRLASERRRGTDEVSRLRVADDGEFERTASAFDAASAAE